ncbi:hypothetical protein C8J95_106279 [Elizabethkingia sp. YR214]|uniref:hypothetical protein n=1 Tax=Elizabethkingia sp. YR214 TaxID=2135667 RepID=UPI000D45BCC9|nr:hypothetical protein [Elizabethkingia sp. YR214]PUB29623.1 hypothetical protein C8J95_106279 [Elizabethkingia sp. YR214]
MKKLSTLLLTLPGFYFAQLASGIAIHDTRSTDSPPSEYRHQIQGDFKYRSTVGVPGEGLYSGMLTIAPWGDNSGDKHHQLNFNNGGIFYRAGLPEGQWEGWKQLLTTNSNGNVGIGTTNPSTNLEIASPNGATLSLTTDKTSAKQENPLYPKIDFLGYANWPKARIAATEQSYDTHGSKLSFFVNDGTGATSLKEMMTINQDSKVGIGTASPSTKLDVSGIIRSSIANDEGGTIDIHNSTKIGSNAYVWRIYNMTGNYGNSLQFWTYSLDGNNNSAKLKLNDNGDIAMYGKLEAKEIKVTTTPTADFVFEDSYQLPDLESVEKHIKEKKHLPEIASAAEMQKEGINIGDFQIKLLQKIEELTLYSIEQNKLNKEQSELLRQQIQLNKMLEERLQNIENNNQKN